MKKEPAIVNAAPVVVNQLLNLKKLSLRWMIQKGVSLAEAEDFYQQSLLKALTSSHEVKDGQKLQSWFMSILRNTFLDHMRAKKLHAEKEAQYKLELDSLAGEIEESFCACVNDYLRDLPYEDQELMQSHFFEGQSFANLALSRGESASNLRVKAHRAKEKLRTMLQDCCGVRKFIDLKDCDCA